MVLIVCMDPYIQGRDGAHQGVDGLVAWLYSRSIESAEVESMAQSGLAYLPLRCNQLQHTVLCFQRWVNGGYDGWASPILKTGIARTQRTVLKFSNEL